MRTALYLFSKIRDQDVDWLVGAGTRYQVDEGQPLVLAGVPIEHLYIVLQGHFNVVAEPVGTVATLGVGELVGELSFLDARPPGASVVASETALVLGLTRKRVLTRLRLDDGFGSRFYHALGVVLADRLRDATTRLGGEGKNALSEDHEADGEMGLDSLGDANLAGVRFDRFLQRLT